MRRRQGNRRVSAALELNFTVTGSGPPLLVLHGLFGAAGNWRSFARQLAPQRQLLCIDLRNHGTSPWADTMGYLEMAADVARLIELEKLARPDILGHSMGGKTAMALALSQPQALGRLIVVDVAPVSYPDRFSAYVDAMQAAAATGTPSRTEIARRLAVSIPEPSVVAFLMTNLVSRGERFEWRLNLDAIGRALPEIREFPAELSARRFDGPTHLITGEHSNYVAPADLAGFTRLFPALAATTIAGAGHWVHAERPTEFLATVRQALDLPA